MSITFEQPTDYPAALVERSRLPKILYTVVDDVVFPIIDRLDSAFVAERSEDYFAYYEFSWADATRKRIEAHLKYKTREPQISSFISAYENEAIALKYPPFTTSAKEKGSTRQATELILKTKGLIPAWITTEAGMQIPIWIEQEQLPARSSVPKSSAWICLAEVRVLLGLKEKHGEQGEWLACGYIPRAMVHGQVVLRGINAAGGRSLDENIEVVERLETREEQRRSKAKGTMAHPMTSPTIPVRTSSLRSHRSSDTTETQESSKRKSKSKTHRPIDSENQRTLKHAKSLLKKALLSEALQNMAKELLQETREMQIQTSLSVPERTLRDRATVDEGADDVWCIQKARSEKALARSNTWKKSRPDEGGESPKTGRGSDYETAQNSPSILETIQEEPEHTSITSTPSATTQATQELDNHIALATDRDSPPAWRDQVLQAPESDIESDSDSAIDSLINELAHTSITPPSPLWRDSHSAPTIQVTPDAPPKSALRGLDMLAKVKTNREKSAELRVRLAEMIQRHGG